MLLAVGGVTYSVGAVFYALKWPNPWPHYVRPSRVLSCLHIGRRNSASHRGLFRAFRLTPSPRSLASSPFSALSAVACCAAATSARSGLRAGTFARRRSTSDIASRSSASHSSACRPTSRTHHAARPTATGHAGVDERVENLPLRLPQPGHHRRGERGEQLGRARRTAAPQEPCGRSGARPRARCRMRSSRGLLAEPRDPARFGSRALGVASASSAHPGRDLADDQDLVPVDVDAAAPVNQPSGRRPVIHAGRVARVGQVGLLPPAAPRPRWPCRRDPPANARCPRRAIAS